MGFSNAKDTLVLMCNCGCSAGIEVKYAYDQIYIDFLQGYFSTAQSTLKTRISDKIRLLGKNRWISGLIVSEDELIQFIKFLEDHPCSDETPSVDGFLKAECLYVYDMQNVEVEEYDITLYTLQPRMDILRGKEYRCGEIVLDDKHRKYLIKILKKELKKGQIARTTHSENTKEKMDIS